MENKFIKEMSYRTAKDGTPFVVKIIKKEGYYNMVALTAEQQHEIGYLNFKISNKDKGKECWIYKIQVAEPFLCQGVGKALLSDFEEFLLSEKVEHIEAKFYPEGPGGSRARKFYEDNLYSIIDNHEIVKYLNPDNCISLNYFANKKDLDPQLSQRDESFPFPEHENFEADFDKNTRHSHTFEKVKEM